MPIITDVNHDFIEDVLCEIDMLIYESNPRVDIQYQLALKDIERSLGCFEYPTRSRTVDLSRDEHPCYISLGAVDDFTDTLLIWAYDRQCLCDPENKPYYLDCLSDLARGRGSPDLEIRVALAASAGELSWKDIEHAYKFFNLEVEYVESDNHIIGIYNSRIASAPRQKDEAKQCLMVVAKHRKSEAIEAIANDKTMSFEEALEFLSVTADTDSESIEAQAVALVRPYILSALYLSNTRCLGPRYGQEQGSTSTACYCQESRRRLHSEPSCC